MGRAIGGIVAGLVLGGALVYAIELAGLRLFPLPAGIDPMNPQLFRQHLSELPMGAFLTVLFAWAVACFVGPLVAQRVSQSTTLWPGLVVGGIFAALCLYNLVTIPHPVWFALASVCLVPCAAWAGASSGRVRPAV